MDFALKLEINIVQKTNYPKKLPFEMITNEVLKYGVFENGLFVINRKDKEGFICFHPEHIGRGIQVQWDEKDEINMKLLLPSTYEEIHDFIEMGLRIAKYWTCSMTLNQELVTSQDLGNMEEDIERMNSKIFKDMVKSLIQDGEEILDLACATSVLALSKKEVYSMKDVTNTNLYRDWLHLKQKEMYFRVQEEYLQKDEKNFGFFTIPLQIPFLILKEPSINYQWIVQFYDVVKNEIVGYLTYEAFIHQLDDFQYDDYDARYWLVKPISLEMAQYLTASKQND